MVNLSEEYCPHCDNYYEIDPSKCLSCPGGCGYKLYPCNQCQYTSNFIKCDWNENIGCSRFDFEPTEAIKTSVKIP